MSNPGTPAIRGAVALTVVVTLSFVLVGCENKVSSTRECLGSGSQTWNYDAYTFDVESGPALDVAGNCHVVLTNCTVRAPEGIRAAENAVVTMRGGSLTATNGVAVSASGNAHVSFEGTQVSGTLHRSGAAQIAGAGDAGP
jgi:hypothetical protein